MTEPGLNKRLLRNESRKDTRAPFPFRNTKTDWVIVGGCEAARLRLNTVLLHNRREIVADTATPFALGQAGAIDRPLRGEYFLVLSPAVSFSEPGKRAYSYRINYKNGLNSIFSRPLYRNDGFIY